jgi:hypothetical protein
VKSPFRIKRAPPSRTPLSNVPVSASITCSSLLRRVLFQVQKSEKVASFVLQEYEDADQDTQVGRETLFGKFHRVCPGCNSKINVARKVCPMVKEDGSPCLTNFGELELVAMGR